VWAGSHIKNAPQMKRMIVNSHAEFVKWVNDFNGKMNCYTTVYDFEHFSEKQGVDSSVILDRIFFDFDSHGRPLEESYDDVKIMVAYLLKEDLYFRVYFSGKGFHIIVYGETVGSDEIRRIQQLFNSVFANYKTLDRTGVQVKRLRRIPNTVNLSSDGPYYCIPLTPDDISRGLSSILFKARLGNHPSKLYGNKRKQWAKVRPMEVSDIEVVSPKPPGKLPILPCLYNSIMVENPSHYSRVYLAQWYRDLLAIGERNLSSDKENEIVEIILEEFKAIASRENVWLDWDENITKRYINGIVRKGYHAPGCKTILIPQGFCIGKCWRYSE